ncbi:MAG: 5'-methylthioadenosine/adenosylhomocysteine nucleosidase [Actinomycetia bacterium]|nr:5'-methylthioadenosine/adenosylhomocysteine nucleosidase [Actinomycetes bacterium]
MAMLGVLGAMTVEVEAVLAALTVPRTERLLGCPVTRGRLAGEDLVVAKSGVGKVNAALATAALARAGATAVVFTGMAGGIGADVHIGDAVVATDLVQHDVDASAFGGTLPGQVPGEPLAWDADVALAAALAEAASGLGATVHRGRIASGDQFIADHARAAAIASAFDALAVEMEGAAAAQAAARLRLPVAVLRWISDTANDEAVTDFPAFCARVAALDLAVVQALVTRGPIWAHVD